MFIDQTQRAQLSTFRLYIEILAKFKIAFGQNGMKGYILSEDDFSSAFQVISVNGVKLLAIRKNENKTRTVPESTSSTDIKSDKKPKRKRSKSTKRKKFAEKS